MITRLQTDIKNFIGILHISDIHIRLTKRHDEYQEIFNKFYDIIDRTPKETAIVVAGDLFHSKSDLSPECVSLASDFLKTLSDKRPTILIAGNHDATLANKNRLDSLSPIVEALNHNNLYYLKDSGLYIFGDLLLNNMSVFDDKEKYILAKDIPKTYRNETNCLIALFHGPVNSAVTELGYVVNNRSIMLDLFDGHEIALLGDIHQYQVMQEYNYMEDKPAVVYPSSMIQQNHGEEINGHGYVLWNVKTKQHKQLNLKNDYGFYTIDIQKGKLITDVTNMPKKVRLRVRCLESVATEVKSVLSEIKKNVEISEVTYVRVDGDNNQNIITSTNLNINEISSVDYQNKLIETHLKNKYSDSDITKDILDKIFEINKELNTKIETDSLVKNIRWKPKKFEFDNMFSYGEGNVIDFTNMKDVIGLFANNAAGKSSILSALCFCIFDKCDRAFKASHVLNSQKMSFKCKFNFEISGVDYFIERTGVADKKGNVKVDVKFWKEENDKKTELNGEARRSTNDIIRDYVGGYDDFILTVLSIQNGKNGSFVDMGQTERKDLLSQFMGLTMFDNLYQLSSDKLKEINGILKTYSLNEDIAEIIKKLSDKIVEYEFAHKKENEECEKLQTQRNEVNNLLIEEHKKIIKLEKNVPTDIDSLENNKIKLGNDLKSYVENKQRIQLSLKQNQDKSVELQGEITTLLEKKNIVKQYNDYNDLVNKLKDYDNIFEKKKIIVSGKLDKIKRLENHKYDPNCKYCVDNAFVKDAMVAKNTIDDDKKEVVEFLSKHDALKKQIEDNKNVVIEYNLYTEKLEAKNKTDKLINSEQHDLLKIENKITTTENNINKHQENIDLYYQQKDAIENNKVVEKSIQSYKKSFDDIDKNIKIKNQNILKINTELVSAKKDKISYEQNVEKIKELEKQNKAYEYYVQSVSRDGIQFELISQAVPVIEKEVNEILHQIVEFGVNIQTDGKNITTYITYPNKKWPLELASGLEKFLTGLAIRVALINISNLPRPNFFAVDEGWGSMDANNISYVGALFSYLKTQFDFILIISHIDSIKDFVDGSMEITKINGFSHIEYT